MSRGTLTDGQWKRIEERHCSAVDAIGPPIRIHPAPCIVVTSHKRGTSRAGLRDIGHVIADAAYKADPLRAFIADDLGATARIKANPSRTGRPPIDWRLYEERHQVERFFDKRKRFRRLPLLREDALRHELRPSRLHHHLATLTAGST